MADLPTDLLEQRLPDWYHAVSIDIDGELLPARRAAIEALGTGLTLELAPQAVAYGHGRKWHGDGLIDWIRQTARETDETFAREARDLEPQVMVACAIAHRLASDPRDEVSTALSLLTHSASFRGFSSVVSGQDLSGIAAHQLRMADVASRRTPSPTSPTAVVRLNTLFKELEEFPDEPRGLTRNEMAPWVSAIRKGLEMAAQRIDNLERALVRSAGLTREQLDQVAWLLDEYCELAGKPWAKVSPAAAVLLAATELADITKTASSPEITVMLKSTLVKAGCDPDAPVDALVSVQRAARLLGDWPKSPDYELAPLTGGVVAWRRLQGKEGWRDLAKTNRHGGSLPRHKAFEVAEQAVRELQVARRFT